MRNLGFVFVATALIATALAGTMATAQENDEYSYVLSARMNTLYGPAGLITVPTAYVTRHNDVLTGMTIGKNNSFSGNYGVMQGIEIGAAYLDRQGASNKTLVNAKVNIIPENFKSFELGIGIIDATDDLDRTYYIVASADWVTPETLRRRVIGTRVHAGYGTGFFDRTLIGGAEFVFNPKLSAVGEYNGDRLNAALRYVSDESFRMQAGFQQSHLFASTSYARRF